MADTTPKTLSTTAWTVLATNKAFTVKNIGGATIWVKSDASTPTEIDGSESFPVGVGKTFSTNIANKTWYGLAAVVRLADGSTEVSKVIVEDA